MRSRDIEESIRWSVDDLVPSCKVYEYQPGNGSRYVISFTKIPAAACEKLGCRGGSWLVALPDGAGQGHCAIFAQDGYLSPSYVQEKLHLSSEDDALVLTEFIGRILGRRTPEALDKEAYVERLQNE